MFIDGKSLSFHLFLPLFLTWLHQSLHFSLYLTKETDVIILILLITIDCRHKGKIFDSIWLVSFLYVLTLQ